MTRQTIIQLNELNRAFYQKIAQPFSDTREYYWEGWHDCLRFLPLATSQGSPYTILDVGCGNGRFGTFIKEHFKGSLFYLGVDSNQQLLQLAKVRLDNAKISHQLIELDIVESLADHTISQSLPTSKPHIISLFGLMHHIPSYELRRQLLQTTWHHLAPGGTLICTFWQFLLNPKLKQRCLTTLPFDIKKEELEPNDYVLDWQRGQQALRYCHYCDEAEIKQLLSDLDLTAHAIFHADGQPDPLNTYLVLHKE